MPKLHNRKFLKSYIKGLISGKYTTREVAESTNYTTRYIQLLKKKYREIGDMAFENGRIGRPCATRINQDTRAKIALLYLSDIYNGMNFRYYSKCLNDDENIKISYTTVRTIMAEYGIISPENHNYKHKEKVHRLRVRRAHEGDLWQTDATPYDWFGNGNMYSIHGGIDDATGKVTAFYMCENECLYGYMECLRLTAKKFGGLPREIYSDRAAIFCVTPKNKNNLTIEEQLLGLHEKRTQWQRILEEVGTKQILAFSPQAKGRVERMWRTLQGRLPFLFKKYGIKTIEEANKFLEKYVDIFNAEFAITPASSRSFYQPQDMLELEKTLVAKYPRQLRSGYISFHNYKFLVPDYRGRSKIGTVCVSDKNITYEIEGIRYGVKLLDESLYTERDSHTPQVLYDIIWRCIKRDGKKEDDESLEESA